MNGYGLWDGVVLEQIEHSGFTDTDTETQMQTRKCIRKRSEMSWDRLRTHMDTLYLLYPFSFESD